MHRLRMLPLVAFLMLVMAVPALAKKKLEKLDDLPRYTYTVDTTGAAFVKDPAAVLKLAAQIRADIEKDLAEWEIEDKTTLQGMYGTLGLVAFLEQRYDDYLKYMQMQRDLEEKEAARLTMGLFMESVIAARRSDNPEFEIELRKQYQSRIKDLPYEIVGDQLKGAKSSAEILSEALILGLIDERIQPVLEKSGGEVSRGIAESLIGYYQTTTTFIPLKHIVAEVLSEYLDAHQVAKADIWAERDFELKEGDGKGPVVIAIWDSGVDNDIYHPMGLSWVNANEIPGNKADDDKNGYVDDVHGIAYTLHADKTPDLLFSVEDVQGDRAQLQRLMKGLSDLQSNIESAESSELKQMMGSLAKEDVKPFIEGISKYGNYAHGTHVAGIAAAGNPFARIMTARITFGHTIIPETPTIEQARKDSIATAETVEYFKKNGVRVVNMSWGGNIAGIESALEANNAGGTPEERKALSREIFEIGRDGLFDAFKNAPEILFVTAAGNSNSDNEFEEDIPSSFDLPNILTVGAVDQAGDETGFTSFGKVNVYANGFEVNSFVPGGDRMNMNGTSMASPQVVNLVGKLLAVNPDLTPTELRQLIMEGCDIKKAGDREVALMNPKKSLMLLAQMMEKSKG